MIYCGIFGLKMYDARFKMIIKSKNWIVSFLKTLNNYNFSEFAEVFVLYWLILYAPRPSNERINAYSSSMSILRLNKQDFNW